MMINTDSEDDGVNPIAVGEQEIRGDNMAADSTQLTPPFLVVSKNQLQQHLVNFQSSSSA